MGTVIRVIQLQKLVDKLFRFLGRHCVVPFYRRFTGHCGKPLGKNLKKIFFPGVSEMIQHIQEKLFLCKTVKIGRHCADTVLFPSKMLDLKPELPEISFVVFLYILLMKI